MRRTHGLSGTPLYRVWSAMKQRCANRKNAAWKNYGGRGITVCARWRTSFEAFLEDMGPCPPGLTLDRLDNDETVRNVRICPFRTCVGQPDNVRPRPPPLIRVGHRTVRTDAQGKRGGSRQGSARSSRQLLA
jgi:hypothetical protein